MKFIKILLMIIIIFVYRNYNYFWTLKKSHSKYYDTCILNLTNN